MAKKNKSKAVNLGRMIPKPKSELKPVKKEKTKPKKKK